MALPYLCAKDGGGLFLLVYLILVLTFGFVLLTTDVAIGRKTKKNALRAFEALNPKWKFLGKLTFLVPTLIMTYYSVIGGWITKYFVTYIISDGKDAAADGYFTSFITSDIAPIVFMLVFLALTAWIVYRGVEKGIEQFFDGCMKEFTGVLPSECMMIGDSLTADIEGGQAYGMSTCWFVHSGDKSAIQQNNGGKVADHIIYELAELKNIL